MVDNFLLFVFKFLRRWIPAAAARPDPDPAPPWCELESDHFLQPLLSLSQHLWQQIYIYNTYVIMYHVCTCISISDTYIYIFYIHMYERTYIRTYLHTYVHACIHYITLHCTALHCIALHCITRIYIMYMCICIYAYVCVYVYMNM